MANPLRRMGASGQVADWFPQSASIVIPSRDVTPILSPLSLPGLISWHDFSSASFLATATNGTGAVSNSSQIAYIADRSGNGWHATQSTANNRPTWNSSAINSLGAGNFNGSSNSLATTGNYPLSGDTPFTVVCVSTRTSGVQWSVSNAGNTQVAYFADGFAGVSSFSFSSPTLSGRFTPSSVTTPVVTSVTVGGSGLQNCYFRRNGSLQAVTSITQLGLRNFDATGLVLRLGIMQLASTSYHLGLLGECVVYGRAISLADLTALERLLGAKWGITVA